MCIAGIFGVFVAGWFADSAPSRSICCSLGIDADDDDGRAAASSFELAFVFDDTVFTILG